MKLGPIKKKYVAVIILATALISSFITYSFAGSISNTLTLSAGVYPGSPSYTIYLVSGTYYAKDQNGIIDYYDTDFDDLLNDAIGSGAENIYLAAGTFVSNDAVYLADNVKIQGAGAGVTRWVSSATNGVLRGGSSVLGYGENNVTISDFTMYSTNGNCITAYDSHDWIIKNMVFDGDATITGIYISGNSTGLLMDSIMAKNVYHGIVTDQADNITISNVLVSNPTYAAIDLSGCSNSVVTNVVVYGYGIKLDWSDAVTHTCYNVDLSNIRILNATYNSVGLEMTYTYDCSLTNIYVESNGAGLGAVRLDDHSGGIEINNLVCRNVTGYGVYCKSNGNIFTGIDIRDCDQGFSISGDYNLVVGAKTEDIINQHYSVSGDHNTITSTICAGTGTAYYETGTFNMISAMNAYSAADYMYVTGANSHATFSWNRTSWVGDSVP